MEADHFSPYRSNNCSCTSEDVFNTIAYLFLTVLCLKYFYFKFMIVMT